MVSIGFCVAERQCGEALAGELVHPLEERARCAAALVVGYRVNFVNDDGFDGLEDFRGSSPR